MANRGERVTPDDRTITLRDGGVAFRVLSAGRGAPLVYFHSFHERGGWSPFLERLYFPHVHYFYQKCLNVWEGFAEAPGYRTVKTLQTGTKPQVGAQAKKIRQSLNWQKYLEQGYVIAGSPRTVREQLTDCIKSLRVGHLMVLLQIGSMPKELTLHNTALFARDVMPHVRDLWPGYKDRWWPSGVPNGA